MCCCCSHGHCCRRDPVRHLSISIARLRLLLSLVANANPGYLSCSLALLLLGILDFRILEQGGNQLEVARCPYKFFRSWNDLWERPQPTYAFITGWNRSLCDPRSTQVERRIRTPGIQGLGSSIEPQPSRGVFADAASQKGLILCSIIPLKYTPPTQTRPGTRLRPSNTAGKGVRKLNPH